MWLGRKGCSLNLMQKESANLRYQPGREDLKWFVKSMFDECRDEGKMGRQTERQVAPEPGRAKPVYRGRVTRRWAERGWGSQLRGGSSLGVQRCSSVRCGSGGRLGELVCCVARRNKNPNAALLLRVQGACTKSWKKGKR